MALVYTVCEARAGREFTLNASEEKVNANWATSYRVQVTDDAAPSRQVTAAEVDPIAVVSAPGLPVVNRTTYFFNGQTLPYLVCVSKRAQQNPDAGRLWDVVCEWDTLLLVNSESEALQPNPPPAAPEDITPVVSVAFEETQKYILTDHDTGGRKPILTPTGNLWAEATEERFPVLVRTVTQIESLTTTDDVLMDRMFKFNYDNYEGKPLNSWIVDGILVKEVFVYLDTVGYTAARQITYRLKHQKGTDNDGVDRGWAIYRALIDTHYLENGLKETFSADDEASDTVGKIDINGARKPPGTLIPDYVQIIQQPQVPYRAANGGWLRA